MPCPGPTHPENLVHDDGPPAHILAVLQDALDDTAPKGVAAEGHDAGEEAVQKVQDAGRRDALDDLLDDMVAVLIAHTAHDLAIQLGHDLTLMLHGQHL